MQRKCDASDASQLATWRESRTNVSGCVRDIKKEAQDIFYNAWFDDNEYSSIVGCLLWP